MSQSISSELLAELSIATFERVVDQEFKIAGQIPAWLQSLKPEIFKVQNHQVNLSELFPFLEYFLADPKSLWPPDPEKTIKSGLWSEQGPLEQPLYLEATALQIGTQEILLIAAQNADIQEKIDLIQKARDNALSYLSDQKHNSQELVSSTFYDALTGLPNQTYFSLQLTQSFESCRQRQDCQAAVVAIAIDQLNLVSGSLGFAASEQLLIEFAWRLKSELAKDAVLARSEGAEFVLLLPYLADPQQVMQLAERLLTALKPPFSIHNQEIFISTSMGVAISHTDHRQAQDLLCDAHTALQQAKSQNGSLILVFEPAMHHQTVRRFQLENDLHHAVGDQELQVHYQPILNINSRQVSGFEAFVRWFHPYRGAIAPRSFLPVAESVGLMSAVDLWLIREACFRIQQWQQILQRAVSVSVNLSARGLHESQLVQQIERVLKETNIDPRNLKLEFNEQILLSQLEAIRPTLKELKRFGVQLCIDGFSGSYLALNTLPELPIDTLKLDSACLDCLSQQPPQYQDLIVGAIQLAHDLNMDVVAKGVEDQSQLQRLAEVGCDFAQGYFFSGPLNSARATQLLNRHQG
ncbi:MAG: putative bifunctional diguanylate cyclase/phosphodiesterase [Thermosynechococcaceae cyanobacterium]